MIPSLVSLYQHSIDREAVFSQWKVARITPIHKKDDETDITKYRPVSLLSKPSKILEELVNDTLVDKLFSQLTTLLRTDSEHTAKNIILSYY